MNQPAASSRFRIAGTSLAVVVVAVVGLLKVSQQRALGRETAQRQAVVAAGPRVRTLVVGADSGASALTFQGETLPWQTATLYAKLAGFLKEVRVDKGSRVRQGDIMAIIQSPETERTALALKTSYENLKRVADRYIELGRQGIANAQDVDNAKAAAQVARENWRSEAEVEGYEKVRAPFTGVVTARLVDPGAFVQNASSSTSSQPMFSLQDVDRLRVTFFVDQSSAARVKAGQEVEVSPAERPDQVSIGRISRVSGALDVRTRTMLAEADLDNHDGRFLAGGYVRVGLKLPGSSGRVEIPAEALLMRGSQPFAATLAGDKVQLVALTLGEDVGNHVRVVKGLNPGVRIILNPNAGLRDGDPVQIIN
ncbi:MAG: efflux RND transporter periplasmic adaptor subunit [Holophaga sp.]|nr:efflux RND transporter periplasmic adaptor subunit [Holophaga sp.]